MDEHNDRFTEEHARQLTEPSEQEWQRQRWLSYYSGPRITVGPVCCQEIIHDGRRGEWY